ncbi:MAG: sugar ABC transporter permease [Treponema sp.]|jgi:multiple sugar transport system permease protein|nr:sugar ABC transporter permease [Treponema sp.]
MAKVEKKKNFFSIKTLANITGWAFAMPALLGYVLLNIVPMLSSLYYSLTSFKGVGRTVFIGFQNYIGFFKNEDPNFLWSVKATLTYAVMAVPANMLFAFSIAMLLNRPMKGRTFFRALFYLPSILPGVATSFVWLLLMNPDFGLFNKILSTLGLPASLFLYHEKSVIPSIVFMGIWGTGSMQVIFLAGLQDIPRVYYEAMDIDGGNAFQKFTKITLPMVSPSIFFNLIMNIIGAMQVFGPAYIMTNGGPNHASQFYVFTLWRQAFAYMNMGGASAMAWILFIVVVMLSLFTFGTSKKWVYYEGEN